MWISSKRKKIFVSPEGSEFRTNGNGRGQEAPAWLLELSDFNLAVANGYVTVHPDEEPIIRAAVEGEPYSLDASVNGNGLEDPDNAVPPATASKPGDTLPGEVGTPGVPQVLGTEPILDPLGRPLPTPGYEKPVEGVNVDNNSVSTPLINQGYDPQYDGLPPADEETEETQLAGEVQEDDDTDPDAEDNGADED